MNRILFLIAALPLASSQALADKNQPPRTITVEGRAEVLVAPDEAVVNLGIETFLAGLDAAKAENDGAVSAVLTAAKGEGVAAEDLKTDFIDIHPRYRENPEERKFLGYSVRRSIAVTIKDIDDFEKVLSAVLEVGANHVYGLEFRTSEPRKHEDEARSLALEAAQEKAAAMAAKLGQKIGRPLKIEEKGSLRRPVPMTQNVLRFSGPGAGQEGPMVPGRIAMSAVVSVTFELVD